MASNSSKIVFHVQLSKISRTEARVPNSRNKNPFTLIQVGLVTSFIGTNSKSPLLPAWLRRVRPGTIQLLPTVF